jgi:hypothetical protein
MPSPKSKPKVTTTTTASSTTTTGEEKEDKPNTEATIGSEKFNKALDEIFEANKRFYSHIVDWKTEAAPKRAKIIARDKQKETIRMAQQKMMMSSPAMQALMVSTFNDMELTSPRKILSLNRGLIHLMHIIDKAPNGQISTRKLLKSINSYDLHHLIKKAEALGFIKREKVPKPHGQKGNNMTINSLTPEGRELLRVADDLLAGTSNSSIS